MTSRSTSTPSTADTRITQIRLVEVWKKTKLTLTSFEFPMMKATSRTRARPKTTSRMISRLSRLSRLASNGPPDRSGACAMPCSSRSSRCNRQYRCSGTAAGMPARPRWLPTGRVGLRQEEQGGLVGEVEDGPGDDPEYHGECHADADGRRGEYRDRHRPAGLDLGCGCGVGQHLDAGRLVAIG